MKKIRKQFKELREGFLTAKIEEKVPAYVLANIIFIFLVFIIICIISAIICSFFQVVGICMIVISIILLFVFMFWNKAFFKTIRISARICNYFLQDTDWW